MADYSDGPPCRCRNCLLQRDLYAPATGRLTGAQMMPPPTTQQVAERQGMASMSAARISNDQWPCDMFVLQLTAFIDGRPVDSPAPYIAPECFADSVEGVIEKATACIQHEPSRFAPAGLQRLLNEVIRAAYHTKRTAVASAAILFIDAVRGYSEFPDLDMQFTRIARFLSWTYCKGKQAHNSKRLAKTTHEVATRFLHGTLNLKMLDALHTVLGGGQGTEGLVECTGALKLLRKFIKSQDAGVQASIEKHVNTNGIASFFEALLYASEASSGVMDEDIAECLTQMLANHDYERYIHAKDEWAGFIRVAERCIARPDSNTATNQAASQATAGSKVLVENLAVADMYDFWYTDNSIRVFQLLVEVGGEIPQVLMDSMLIAWDMLLREGSSKGSISGSEAPKISIEQMLTTLGQKAQYSVEIVILVDKLVSYLLETNRVDRLGDMVALLQVSALAPTNASEMASGILYGVVQLFEHELSRDTESLAFKMLFESMCEIAGHSLAAVKVLFRIRKDVAGVIYLYPAPQTNNSQTFILDKDLPMTKWFQAVCDIFQSTARTKEVFDYSLQATRSLLGNHIMFLGEFSYVRIILDTITELLLPGGGLVLPEGLGLSRIDVAAHLVQILATIASYHGRGQLVKQDLLDLVFVLDKTAGSQDQIVTIQCIHALTICCYEVPAIMSSKMDGIITTMTRLVTQQHLAIHILQFLAGLSRLPVLYHNFTEKDFKKIFGVCHNYLQSTRGLHPTRARQRTPTSERSSTARDEEALPEYVYALAHHVITFWYLSTRMQDRSSLKTYIKGFLTYKNAKGEQDIEDQGIVTIDMIDRVDSDGLNDESAGSLATPADLLASKDGLHRIVGLLLVTTKPSNIANKVVVTVRRPSGNASRIVEKEKAVITMEGGDRDLMLALPNNPKFGVMVTIPSSTSVLGSKDVITLPYTLPLNDGVRRAIEALDRTFALDSHKAGVIYIDEGQTTVEEVLRNIEGSEDYEEFRSNLGDKMTLKGAEFNTQGLDRRLDVDGESTVVWHNRVTEVVFHITTMMPNDPVTNDLDQTVTRKTSHIGNDHVNVVFNMSGGSLDYTTLYNMFPNQFTYVYIVITPSARTSIVNHEDMGEETDPKKRFHYVKVCARPGYPNISPAADEKVVSGASLPGFIRNLVLNECVISLMWTPRNDSSEYPSSWRSRLEQIKRMGVRYAEK